MSLVNITIPACAGCCNECQCEGDPCTGGGSITVSGTIDYLDSVEVDLCDGSYTITDTPYPWNDPLIPSSTDLSVVTSGCLRGTPSFSGGDGDGMSVSGCSLTVTLDDKGSPGAYPHSVTITFS